jgi:hypothetical protein
MTTTTGEFTKIVEGGSSPTGDYFRKAKIDGSTTSPQTNQQLKESGAGFWADMARQGGQVYAA